MTKFCARRKQLLPVALSLSIAPNHYLSLICAIDIHPWRYNINDHGVMTTVDASWAANDASERVIDESQYDGADDEAEAERQYLDPRYVS